MTLARRELVDMELTRYYHCLSRCVRGAMLCGESFEHRKQWIEERLEQLAGSFAISVCGYAVMDNHLHVLVRLDPSQAERWSGAEVIRRWLSVFPPRSLEIDDPKIVQRWVEEASSDTAKVQRLRRRLQNLGWFMKSLKEPLARQANREDGCRGAFWEGRYKSIAILDEEALLATCAYIDLNPLAAGLSSTPEGSRYTSVRQRVGHARQQGQLESLRAAARGSVAGSRGAGRLEESHWLCPLEDRRRVGSAREGMLESFSLGSYLLLVDYTSRLYRSGKARVSQEVAGILERLGTTSESWGARLGELFRRSRLLGSFFSTRRDRLRAAATRRGVHHVDNVVSLRPTG